MKTAFEIDRAAAIFSMRRTSTSNGRDRCRKAGHSFGRTTALGRAAACARESESCRLPAPSSSTSSARDDVAFVGASRERLDVRGVEARIGLGHAEAHFLLSPDERGQPARLLLLGAVHDDRVRPKRLTWMVDAAENPPPPRVTACIMMAASVTPSPAPPSSTGMVMPSQPASAIA